MKITFLVDEDLPRSTARVLNAEGYEALDVRDVGLSGHPDQEVFRYAQSLNAALLTADTDFANALRFPPGSHAGIVVSRIPDEVSSDTLNRLLLGALRLIEPEEVAGAIIIVEANQVRIRR